MRLTHLARRAGSERGFSMFLVVVGMLVTSMFVAAAFAAANGDLPISGASKDRKTAYAAAEAGLNFYATHLNQDPDYWTHCENVPAPGPGQPNPVNTVWNGVGADPRTWRNVATGVAAQYTVEVLPAPGNAKCVEGQPDTVLNQSTGTFRIRFTGRPRAGSTMHRSIIATFKRKGFLDYLWFTDFEDLDPQALASQASRDDASDYCGGKYRWERPVAGAPSGFACQEIEWISGDVTDGPLHSNDSLLICGAPTFGHDRNDVIEVVPDTNGRVPDKNCSDNTNMLGQWQTGAEKMQAPTDNQPLKAVAASADGKLFTGRTYIRLNGASMTVTTDDGTTSPPMAVPKVIYVDSDTPRYQCVVTYPVRTDYSENDQGCGNVYISGTYSKSVTIAAANDVILAPTSGGAPDWKSTDEALTMSPGSDAVLGLIANRFVRVGHKVTRGSPCTNVAPGFSTLDLEVDAAILALQHSWIVDNYDCAKAGSLTVTGAIAQEYRGPVGTSGHTTGFLKDYHYDKRLRYRSPPYFLSPIDASWSAVRRNEQVPAT
jgi:Tfp pilus assembly protein PilX